MKHPSAASPPPNGQGGAFRAALAASLPVLAGYLVLGFAFGILLADKGYSIGWALLMSAAIYAGSMQFVTVDLLAGGASLLSTALMTLLVNARHFIYGISMLARYRDAGRAKPYLIFSLSDETYALLCRGAPYGVDEKRFDLYVSLLDQLYWIAGSLAGAAAGAALTVDTTGIDFAMTALFVVIFTEQWQAASDHAPALIGLGTAAICLAVFGADGFLIPAMVVMVALLCLRRPKGAPKAEGEGGGAK